MTSCILNMFMIIRLYLKCKEVSGKNFVGKLKVLYAIVLLLTGVIVWGCLGRLEVHTDAGGVEEVAPIEFVIN